MARIRPQNYPRINDPDDKYDGYLDDSQLVQHIYKIPQDSLKQLIHAAIENANQKSSREMLSIDAELPKEVLIELLQAAGRDLFRYFKKYPGDPASTAHQVYGQHYRKVAIEQFRNQLLQKERMNSGWRYQFLAVDCARESRRFRSVSDIGAAEADFNAIIDFVDSSRSPLSLYVSVKNRTNTMGGQDWPKAIHALEAVANNDKNRQGPYLCVFGIAMEKGERLIKRQQKTRRAHSDNTEVWKSDYFWPFFANYSYEEIMMFVLDVLIDTQEQDELPLQIEIPDEVLDAFGEACREFDLIDEDGIFNNPHRLVQFFVGSL